MPRKKAISELKPWLSANPDNKEKRFIQKGNSFLFNSAVQDLTGNAYKLYDCLCMESAGKREFTFTLQTAKKYGRKHNGSLRRYIQELEDKGFIETVENNRSIRKPNVYRFSYAWKGIDSRKNILAVAECDSVKAECVAK